MERASFECFMFTFTFTFLSVPVLDMLTVQHQAMNRSLNPDSRRIYRKRADPVRVVSFATLNKTAASLRRPQPEALVNSSNGRADDGLWQPMPRRAIEVSVSPSSWSGLHSRVMASRQIPMEAF